MANGTGGPGVMGGDERKTKDPQALKEPKTQPPSEGCPARQLESNSASQLSSSSHSHLDDVGETPLTLPDQATPSTAERPPAESVAPAQPQGVHEKDKTSGVMAQEAGKTDESHQVSNGAKKKQSRIKKKMKLSLLSVTEGNVAKCQLLTATGHQIHFQFSMDYDKPKEIFSKLVREGGERQRRGREEGGRREGGGRERAFGIW